MHSHDKPKKEAAINVILKLAEDIYAEDPKEKDNKFSQPFKALTSTNGDDKYISIIPELDRLIRNFQVTYGDDSIKDLAQLKQYIGRNSVAYGKFNGEDIKGDILILAIIMDKPDLVKALLNIVTPNDSMTKSKNSFANNLKPIHVACMNNRVDMIKVLLEINNDYLHLSDGGWTIFTNVMDVEIYKIILDHLKQQIRAGQVIQDPNAYELLAELRIHYLTVDDKTSERRHVIDEICGYLKPMICESKKMKVVEFDFNHTSTINSNHQVSHQTLFNKALDQDTGTDKDAVLRRANSTILMLFSNPERCVPYLRFLNDEYARYCQQYPEDQFTASSVKPEMITWQEIFSLTVPVANADYATPKKHSRLQEFLLSLFKQYGMGDEVIKWVGFVPTDVANQQIGGGNLVIESVYGSSSLFHGALSHMIQTAMMIYAYERGDIELSGTSIKELIHSQVSTPSTDKSSSSIWLDLRDRVNYFQACFYDPFRVNEVVMRDRSGDMPELAAFMRDSFIGQTKRFANKVLERKPDFRDAGTLLSKMADLEPRLFYRNDLLIEEAAFKLKNSGHKVKYDTVDGIAYATAVRAAYPVRKDFQHHRFSSIRSSDYEVIVKRDDVPPGHAVYIGGADDKLGNWSTAYRMYYDNEKKHWAFNLPRGISSKDFSFVIGPMYLSAFEKDKRGIFIKVDKDIWQGKKLGIEKDDSKELLYHFENGANASMIQCIKKLGDTKSKEEVKSILCSPDQKTGNTILHLVMISGIINIELLNLLLEHGADVTTENKKGESVFTITTSYLNYYIYNMRELDKVVLPVLKAHPCINEQADALASKRLTPKGRSALAFLAIEMNNMSLLDAAIKHGVEPHYQNKNGRVLLDFAIKNDNLDAVKHLFEKWPHAQQELKSDSRIFHGACVAGSLEMVQLLVQQNVDLNAFDISMLAVAIFAKKYNIIEYLLDNTNIDVNKPGWFKQTPLTCAIEQQNTSLVTKLLDKGADVNLTDDRGNTSLTWAAAQGDMVILGLILNKNPSLNSSTDEGATPVFYAAKNGHIEVVEELLKRGAKTDFVLKNGESLLSAAYERKDNAMMQLLLAYRVTYTKKDLENNYFREIACQMLVDKMDAHDNADFKTLQLTISENVLLQHMLKMSLEGAAITPLEQRISDAAKVILTFKSPEMSGDLRKSVKLHLKIQKMLAMRDAEPPAFKPTSTGFANNSPAYNKFFNDLRKLNSDQSRIMLINENIDLIENGFNMWAVLKTIENMESRISIAMQYLSPICRIVNGTELGNILECIPQASRLIIALNLSSLCSASFDLSSVIQRLDVKHRLAYAYLVLSENTIKLSDYGIELITKELPISDRETFTQYIQRKRESKPSPAPSTSVSKLGVFKNDNEDPKAKQGPLGKKSTLR